ncbi:hypothetical protein ACFSC4_20220 [Deinococcus malanensis]
MQERIPDDYTSWEVAFEVDGQPALLSCIAPSEFGAYRTVLTATS